MEDKCFDAIFGEMQYKHRWFKTQKDTFFGNEYEVKVVAKAYTGKEITDAQRDAYKKFLDNANEYKEAVSKQLMDYVNSNLIELAESWTGARKIESEADLVKIVTPKTILVKQDGTLLILLDCVWDVENGVAVKLMPEVAVGSQDLFL